jgi:hypothetical protein
LRRLAGGSGVAGRGGRQRGKKIGPKQTAGKKLGGNGGISKKYI